MIFTDNLRASRKINLSFTAPPFLFVTRRVFSIGLLATTNRARHPLAHRPQPSIAALMTLVFKIIDFWRLEGSLMAIIADPSLHKVTGARAKRTLVPPCQPKAYALSIRRAKVRRLSRQRPGQTRLGIGEIFEGALGT
ncbi:hypothetical protein [Rhodospirillum rubrum]|uniref:hypothetical protein n=1 Tax=Rhodospirillum rubrum TaxID=1085 RepID=UPI0019043349|nr:hypothetical protein [Rhodospirillum rubrum]